MTPPLACAGIVFRRGRRVVLDDVSLQLRPGCRTALLGPNGSGKTTLLRILLGLLTPAAGRVSLQGETLDRLSRRAVARRIAYVPQEHVPVFPYPAAAVVALGRIAQGGPWQTAGTADREAAQASLVRMGIAHLAARPYTELSGGERRSVLLARALAQGARILVLDEPMNGLDFGQQHRLQAILRGLAGEGYAILSTSHDPLRLQDRFDDAILLCCGRLQWSGPAEAVDAERIAGLYGVPPEAAGSQPMARQQLLPT